MNEKKYESTFIPCGDALEKMDLFADDEQEKTADSETEETSGKDSD